MEDFLEDAQGNKCEISYFGSREKAQQALDSCINCRNCTNCANCTNCRNCRCCEFCINCRFCAVCNNCSDCSNSRNCINCSDCFNCAACVNFKCCRSCINCRNCDTCRDCTNCANCTNCSDCHNCIGIKNCKSSLIVGSTRSDGYQFVVSVSGTVHAGCRCFNNIKEARKHWRETKGSTPLGKETFRILKFIHKEYKIRVKQFNNED
jgi:hypothetical protein